MLKSTLKTLCTLENNFEVVLFIQNSKLKYKFLFKQEQGKSTFLNKKLKKYFFK